MALPSYEARNSTATANLNFNERYSFETIARVAKNLSYHLNSKIAHHVAVNRVEDPKKLSAQLDRLSTIIAAAVTPKFAAAPTHSGNAINCPRAACYGAMHVLAHHAIHNHHQRATRTSLRSVRTSLPVLKSIFLAQRFLVGIEWLAQLC
jgi:hypothetical protein